MGASTIRSYRSLFFMFSSILATSRLCFSPGESVYGSNGDAVVLPGARDLQREHVHQSLDVFHSAAGDIRNLLRSGEQKTPAARDSAPSSTFASSIAALEGPTSS